MKVVPDTNALVLEDVGTGGRGDGPNMCIWRGTVGTRAAFVRPGMGSAGGIWDGEGSALPLVDTMLALQAAISRSYGRRAEFHPGGKEGNPPGGKRLGVRQDEEVSRSA